MICLHCESQVVGDAHAYAGGIVHSACAEAYERSKTSRPHRCPKCTGSGMAAHPTQTERVKVPLGLGETPDCAYNGCRGCGMCGSTYVETPVKVKCDLCDGHGWTATKAAPRIVTKQEGWTL